MSLAKWYQLDVSWTLKWTKNTNEEESRMKLSDFHQRKRDQNHYSLAQAILVKNIQENMIFTGTFWCWYRQCVFVIISVAYCSSSMVFQFYYIDYFKETKKVFLLVVVILWWKYKNNHKNTSLTNGNQPTNYKNINIEWIRKCVQIFFVRLSSTGWQFFCCHWLSLSISRKMTK